MTTRCAALLCACALLFTAGAHAMANSTGKDRMVGGNIIKMEEPGQELLADFATGSGMAVGGAIVLDDLDFYKGAADGEAENIIMQMRNISMDLIEDMAPDARDVFDKEISDAEDAVKGKTEQYAILDGVRRIGAGSDLLANVTAGVADDAALFDTIVNTTILTNLNLASGYALQLLNITTSELATRDPLASQSNRKLLQSSSACTNINWATVTTAQLQACNAAQLSSGLRTQTSSLQSSQQALLLQTYDRMCVRNMRKSFSDDLKDNLDDHKTMKTCNDFWGCRECMEGRRNGGYVTQEDCNWIRNDRQQWKMITAPNNTFIIENDEYDNCILAPSGAKRHFTSEKCDKNNKYQQFEILEMSASYGDPRIVLRLAGSGVPGLCMTTERADDDDGIKFIAAPCTCSWSQILERDD